MTFCPKCNNPTKDTTIFCTKYGTPLNQTTDQNQPNPQTTTTPPTTQEPNQQTTKKEEVKEVKSQQATTPKQSKGERGALSCLTGGLILITFGAFAVMQISNPNSANTGQNWAIMLLLIGVIIIVGAIYLALTTQHHTPHQSTTPKPQNTQQQTQTEPNELQFTKVFHNY